ncbi:unnamed protein product [Peniophora sp. CBMAI 1063]|nr:unnamed protein product [Peniophora sp. CBMAI 1063]
MSDDATTVALPRPPIHVDGGLKRGARGPMRTVIELLSAVPAAKQDDIYLKLVSSVIAAFIKAQSDVKTFVSRWEKLGTRSRDIVARIQTVFTTRTDFELSQAALAALRICDELLGMVVKALPLLVKCIAQPDPNPGVYFVRKLKVHALEYFDRGDMLLDLQYCMDRLDAARAELLALNFFATRTAMNRFTENVLRNFQQPDGHTNSVEVSESTSSPIPDQETSFILELSAVQPSDPKSRADPTISARRDLRLASFGEMTTGGTGSRSLGAASTALSLTKDVLEAVDTLPFIKYLASAGKKLLEYIIDAQIQGDMFQRLALQANDFIVILADAWRDWLTIAESFGESDKELRLKHSGFFTMDEIAERFKRNMSQFTRTMEELVDVADKKVARNMGKKMIETEDDKALVEGLREEMKHAHTIFQMQRDLIHDRMLVRLNYISQMERSPRVETALNLYLNESTRGLSSRLLLLVHCPSIYQIGLKRARRPRKGTRAST